VQHSQSPIVADDAAVGDGIRFPLCPVVDLIRVCPGKPSEIKLSASYCSSTINEAPAPNSQEAQPATAGDKPSPVGMAGQGKLRLKKIRRRARNFVSRRRLSLGP
jgi:hypothetical protein